MDLGLKGRTAIVCAASKGLGRACALALAAEGVDVVVSARGRETLEATAADIRERTGVKVTAVACDVTTDAGRQAILAACPTPDILITNAGGPPPGDFREFELDDWRRAVEANMLTPIALIRATIYGMMDRGFGRVVNITSFSVKAPIDSLELSNGARAGLTGAVSALSRKAAARGVTVNNLLPGPFDTERVRDTTLKAASASGRSPEEVERERKAQVPAGRFGRPEEFGATAAFLCSAHAGFITGQNLVLDGGSFRGTL